MTLAPHPVGALLQELLRRVFGLPLYTIYYWLAGRHMHPDVFYVLRAGWFVVAMFVVVPIVFRHGLPTIGIALFYLMAVLMAVIFGWQAHSAAYAKARFERLV